MRRQQASSALLQSLWSELQWTEGSQVAGRSCDLSVSSSQGKTTWSSLSLAAAPKST